MDPSSVLIIGSDGQLGKALAATLPEAKLLSHKDLDISVQSQVSRIDLSDIKAIINAAAYTNVDECESESGRIKAWLVNATGCANIARVALEKDIVLVHISSDYVFDGTVSPHSEDEPLSPLGVYGQSKAAGDIATYSVQKLYLIRTSWVIGDGKNFVRTMLDLAQKGISPRVVSDQIGRPSFADVIAEGIIYLLSNGAEFGTYNISNEGPAVSWADFAKKIFSESGQGVKVSSISSAEYFADKPGVAPRPLNSTFDLSKIESVGFRPKDWYDSLAEYIERG